MRCLPRLIKSFLLYRKFVVSVPPFEDMGELKQPEPMMMIVAAFSRHDEALDWTREWAVQRWGSLACESPRFEFTETEYYTREMGSALKKTFFAFERLVPADSMPSSKLASNAAERDYAGLSRHDQARPLNIDPGHLNLSKFLLATTKDHAHRIYLGESIYAEITLRYLKGRWQPWEWTYPDYCRDDFRKWFNEARDAYRELLKQYLAP